MPCAPGKGDYGPFAAYAEGKCLLFRAVSQPLGGTQLVTALPMRVLMQTGEMSWNRTVHSLGMEWKHGNLSGDALASLY